jgi:hypothetical protein
LQLAAKWAEHGGATPPNEWESFDVTLVGRTVTVVRDGTLTIDHKEIDGITGGALDANEGEPGSFTSRATIPVASNFATSPFPYQSDNRLIAVYLYPYLSYLLDLRAARHRLLTRIIVSQL